MMNSPSKRCIVVSGILLVVFACSREAQSASGANAAAGANASATGSSSGSNWIANGATACEKYLTSDVVAAILRIPADRPQRLDAHSCHAGIVYIDLKVADIDVFRREVPMIAGAHPMAGVGDGAYWNEAGAVSAVKGHDRGCDISIVGIPGQMKIHGAALGQKLGEICNRLFALP
jgi:hypothetical protein